MPVLLPYKPRGSEELFYVPQTETDSSSTDTTVESTHTGIIYSYLYILVNLHFVSTISALF